MRFLVRALAFVLPLLGLAVLCERVAAPMTPERAGPTIEEQIRESFDAAGRGGYEMLILGNSRLYRGVDPDRLGVPAYDFAQPDDSFNQIFHKLKYLEGKGVRPRTLVIGIDYFQFSIFADLRNRFYGRYFDSQYLQEYADTSRSTSLATRLLHPINQAAFNDWLTTNLTRPAAVLMEAGAAKLLGDPPPARPRIHLKPNGQYILDLSVAQPWDVIARETTRLPLQVRYFHATLAWARAHGAKVVLVMLPVRAVEIRSYKEGAIPEMEAWLQSETKTAGVPYLNYATDSQFSDADFADITHLNEAGAEKFSERLAIDLARLGLRSQ